jgi:hypothetical protein
MENNPQKSILDKLYSIFVSPTLKVKIILLILLNLFNSLLRDSKEIFSQ